VKAPADVGISPQFQDEIYTGLADMPGCNCIPGDPSLRAHMRSRFVQDDKGFKVNRGIGILRNFRKVAPGPAIFYPFIASILLTPPHAQDSLLM
jgi:hypothetical protein